MIGVATFAAGCFWRVEALLAEVPGVLATEVGYTGGWTRSPTYEQVCAGATGHAEAVRVDYDPRAVTYLELLARFFELHDAGRRRKPQYRSAVFTSTPLHTTLARAVKAELERADARRLLTEITPLARFYRAEDRHQHYLARRGRAVVA